MTRSEQERLVERYLSGEMISADEEEFFMQVAVDQDLRQTLKAYRIVESAIRKHRDNAPSHHDQSRARFITMLSAHAAAHPTAADLEAAHPTASRGSAFRSVGKRLGRRITVSATALQWLVGAVTVLGVTIGAVIVAPLINDSPDAPSQGNAPAAQPASRPGPGSASPSLSGTRTPSDEPAGDNSAGVTPGAASTAPAPVSDDAPASTAPASTAPASTAPASTATVAPATRTPQAPRTSHRAARATAETVPAGNRTQRAASSGATEPESPAGAASAAPARKTSGPKVVVRNKDLKVRVRVDNPDSTNR